MTSHETPPQSGSGAKSIDVHDEPDQHRYVIEVDGELAGFAVYHRRAGRHLFVHTEIGPAHGGQGLGSLLARGALDDVMAKGELIVPICPFIAGWIAKHPEYERLIDHDLLERIAPGETD